MMHNFWIASALQIGVFLVIGSPWPFVAFRRTGFAPALGWLFLAPGIGALTYMGCATILHYYGLGGKFTFFALLLSALIVSAVIGIRSGSLFVKWLVVGICIISAATVIVLAVDAGDIGTIGIDAYFPLTNGDTFAYMGHVDQIRCTGWNEPTINYPAGYMPGIGAGPRLRTPGVILIADFADALDLQTHSAFFLTQRTAVPLIILASTGIALLVSGGFFAPFICFVILSMGNFLLHQVLQQFNSSSMGSVTAPVIIALALWTAREERKRSGFLLGSWVAGLATGAMALISPEAHLFYVTFLALVFGYIVLIRSRFDLLAPSILLFVLAYLAMSHPLIFSTWPQLLYQYKGAAGGHPGDWIAASGFLLQVTGVTFTNLAHLSEYPQSLQFVSLGFLIIFGLTMFALLWGTVRGLNACFVRSSDSAVLFLAAVVMLACQIYLFSRGAGYGMLKVTDYFAFLPGIVIGVGLWILVTAIHDVKTRYSVIAIIVIACLGFAIITTGEKGKILRQYIDVCKGMPAPQDYLLDAQGDDALITPNLYGDPLGLFLYMNRWASNHISFNSEATCRFIPKSVPGSKSNLMVRISQVGFPGQPLCDITYVAGRKTSTTLEVLPLAGQVMLRINLIRDDGWLDPEGGNTEILRRWLSRRGCFTVYCGPSSDAGSLQVDLAPGPDMVPGNRVEIYLSDLLVASIAPEELPKLVVVPLSDHWKPQLDGEIRISGPVSGIRQVSVSHLRTIVNKN